MNGIPTVFSIAFLQAVPITSMILVLRQAILISPAKPLKSVAVGLKIDLPIQPSLVLVMDLANSLIGAVRAASSLPTTPPRRLPSNPRLPNMKFWNLSDVSNKLPPAPNAILVKKPPVGSKTNPAKAPGSIVL